MDNIALEKELMPWRNHIQMSTVLISCNFT